MIPPMNDASQRQRQAADPRASVWVAASAGTGKTKVLTDRVLSLLLAGSRPGKLLCLTFTKAAAAEMANRINARLARWATLPDAELSTDLEALRGIPADERSLTTARRLFAEVLDTPGGMHIETLHAFCQSLLRRFPLEAGLAPHFQVMDERDAGEMLATAHEVVLTRARLSDDSELAQALAAITTAVHETRFPDLMAALSGERGRLRRLFDRCGSVEGAIAALAQRLGIDPTDTADSIITRACTDKAFDATGCRATLDALRGGTKTDVKKCESMAAWLADPDGRADSFAKWQEVFLTKDGTTRSSLCTKGVEAAMPGTLAILQNEAERLLRLSDRIKSATITHATAALLRLGGAMLESYEAQKHARAMLDYDDLIQKAGDLLERDGRASWVLYKLDDGFDHVLIDEAQDTNPDQWRIVRVLADEFFAGRGQRTEGSRTVFAVGDAKQSIYSFQRADPRAFEEMRHRLAAQIPAAGGKWDEVALSVSFRSTKAVLDAVDAVIASPGGRIGVLAEGEVIEHRPHRSGAAGLVEIWPPVEPKLVDETDAWKPPINPVQGDSPRGRLARLMALRIKAMLDHGERLESKGQPIRPGDIMVLVRRRGAFVEELVKALKQLEIPVAGADRMILTEQLAVMDLMALANAVLLPEDNLTLATLLKSPLLGLSETALFTLAHGRSGSLWDALRQRRNDPTYAEAWDRLSEWLALADRVTPHEFFAHVLENGGKQRLLTRLGMEAEDPLDEFMSLTLAHERLHPPSLQAFLHWLEEGGVEIKRDMEGGVNAVRIMTVHGSKGLQAPIVFLPDTLQAPSKSPGLFWLDEGERELLAWPPRSADQDETCRTARDAANQARDQEYRRLLYVAMTRAEDRLYVCGWHTRKEAPAHCWYYLIREALQDRDDVTEEIDGFLASRPEADGEGKVLRLRCPQTADLPPPKNQADTQASQTLPAWARQAAPVESSPPRPLAPSRPDGDEPAPRSPFGGDDGARFRRGRLIHRLLQSLPDLPTHKRAQAAAHFLGRPAWELSRGQQAEIASEVAAVLADPLFGPIFGPASRAEVPVVGMVGERVISGQVDRLLVTDDSVLIVDYKTNRPPPLDPRDVAPIYLRQMAAYRAALACIYPGKRIRCALLWTDGPRLMPLDGAMLDDALAGLLGV